MINARDLFRSARAMPRVEVAYLIVVGATFAAYLVAVWSDDIALTESLYVAAMLIGFPASAFAYLATYMLLLLVALAETVLFGVSADVGPAWQLWLTGAFSWLIFMAFAFAQAELARFCLRRLRSRTAPAG